MTDFLKACVHGLISGLGGAAGIIFANRTLQGHLWQELLSVAAFVLLIELIFKYFARAKRRAAQ